MPNLEVSKITVPVEVSGIIQNVTYDIKDDTARQMISDLGNALYWVGVTTTALTNGDTTNPITVNGESVTVRTGALTQYNGEEFAWNGSAWQSMGRQDFGDLAFKNSVEATYTPQGTVNITQISDSTDNITGITNVGSLPSFSYSAGTETLTFNSGSLPTADVPVTVVTASGAVTAAFVGTEATITSD